MKLQIAKVVSAEDIKQLAQAALKIWNEYYIQIITKEQIDYMVNKFQSAEAIADQIENQGYEYYLLKPEDAIAGYIGVKETPQDFLFLSKFYILKENRGKGYAREAMDFMTELCKQRGIKKIWLTVNRNNENSIKVYEKFGFHVIKTQVSDIGNGYVMDDFIMEKDIL
ncbi:GNAT family N-acetyltransferase [Anaerocolumna chitinilytica]|uniref:N-acetyltransferase domain-containing protein n=1 Tax=Anaerocolumna chitinilytica TaxID=1727145 RepID=A0A7I8DK05_9FIRM|nr:GNAT family N-acetyltransferase [Anaerocolumna chitinilytica]BCJ98808.1 hypothetical protein bsdcttw_18490 [Anaerocolumna chitinilytica]